MRGLWVFTWRKDLLVFGLLVMLSVAIMAFEGAVQGNPVFSTLAKVFVPFQSLSHTLMNLAYLQDENAALRGRLAQVSADNAVLREQVHETERLMRLLEFRSAVAAPMVAARVIGLADERMGGGLVVDRGADAGITRNMSVVSPEGLVGLVTHVGPSVAGVKRIVDPGSRVSVMLQRSRATGILKAESDGRLLMEWVAPDAEIVPRDTVISSGLGSVVPKGIPVGRVVDLKETPEKFSLSLEVRAFTDFDRLEEVFVVLRRPPETPVFFEDAGTWEGTR